ncbi:MAG: D-glycero-beta-D-manno-heptose 1-phosphate adenylyltransferase [Dehalococcoidia bacterium]|nr:D-glycero-beta-D-manno-heptose 1-phosphate adenylyltransferase [Dehalococcoidia bacterium]
MTTDLLGIIGRFPTLRVLVVGEAMLDSYLLGDSTRICREAPAPIVDVTERLDACGGASNAAANARALGADVTFLTVFGDDDDGDRLLACLGQAGIRADHALRSRERATLTKQRVVAGPQLLARFDQGSTEPLPPDLEAAFIARLRHLYLRSDVVIVSDYGYGLLTPGVVAALADLQRSAPRPLVVDSKDLARYRHVGVTCVKPNFEEAARLLGGAARLTGERAASVVRRASRLFERTGAEVVAVTLDAEGAVILERGGEWYRTYAEPAPNSRAAGAGDTFVATIAMGLAAGAAVQSAAELAAAASQVVVRRDGTTTITGQELEAAILGVDKVVGGLQQMRALTNAYRQQGARIVFTNGCFDIIHRGHVTYLSQAKALGDVLVVGVNSDESVRRLKGAARPVNSFEGRAQVLAALSSVDHVVQFIGDTPEELIRLIGPDVYAKGGDYSVDTLPEAPLVRALGGEVALLPYVEGNSTTSLIDQIRGTPRTAVPSGTGTGA